MNGRGDRARHVGRLADVDLSAVQPLVRRADLSRGIFDLAVELAEGIPTWSESGDPPFLRWMTMTPAAGRVDQPQEGWARAGRAYLSDCFTMPTHAGTHIDCLNHVGRDGRFWGGVEIDDVLGSREVAQLGAQHLPPLVMRGVLVDLAPGGTLERTRGVGPEELETGLARAGVGIEAGDVVLLRTGWMRNWRQPFYLGAQPGLTRAGAEWLAERGAAAIGADNAALELQPSPEPDDAVPVHTFLLYERGIPIIENLALDELSEAGVHEFLFVALPLKLRGATAAPLRPIAIALER
ncbi:cyclase family protein [Conexibacter sp. CPCC 206217]|uniref:cyclase family protein n=1 Tax=Conexibacter sp. CPCC 206217 TaxID=3064574 RepID=UPI00271BE3DA|nr:cyclase family protein [Conexibacter sp. CPCC 206217]MDO8210176.1 cyclase family protein [Conexibacter sp. CPCC 206217]